MKKIKRSESGCSAIQASVAKFRRRSRQLSLLLALITLAQTPMIYSARNNQRAQQVQQELRDNRDHIQQEIVDQLIDFMVQKKVAQMPLLGKRSIATTEIPAEETEKNAVEQNAVIEYIDGDSLRAAPYEIKQQVLLHLPKETREALFNKLAHHLMHDGPAKKPFHVPSGTHMSQMDTFFLLAALLCEDAEQRYAPLRDAALNCVGENAVMDVKGRLKHVTDLMPSDFKKEFFTNDLRKIASMVMRLQPLMKA